MKKIIMFIVAGALSTAVFAGGLLTNTNQNVRFLRNPARNASTDIDAVFSNPAGLAFMEHNGFTLSLNNQSAFQTRTINSTFAPFAMNGGSETKEYKGTTTAWFVPSVQAAYKTDRWVFSGSFAIVGGGGSLKFDQGLPSFEGLFAGSIAQLSNAAHIPTTYSLNMNLEGTSITYGAQLGVTYKISDMFSAFVGGRASFVGNGYKGYLNNVKIDKSNELITYFTVAATTATQAAGALQPAIDNGAGSYPASAVLTPDLIAAMAAGLGMSTQDFGKLTISDIQKAFNMLAAQANGAVAGINQLISTDVALDTKQLGWGIAPILGFDFKYDNLLIALKYDFKTNITLKNKTAKDIKIPGVIPNGMYPDGAESRYDIPALLSAGVSYKFFDKKLTASVGSHIFFDKNAKMTNNRQDSLKNNTFEWLAGLEYRINKTFLISAGGQISRSGLTDGMQSDMNFNLNSSSIGFGGEINITDRLSLNLAYLFTMYKKYTNNHPSYANKINPAKEEVYNRSNKAFGIALDYKF